MTSFSGPPSEAIRNKPITAEIKAVLEAAAQASGVTAIHINSGGQDALGEGNRRTGSTRHDRGRAADIQCMIGNRTLSFTNQQADPEMIAFVTAAAAAGANGIGAGTDYMGPITIHVGFGLSLSDHSNLTWGKNGASANAPQWLRAACAAGWANTTPTPAAVPPPAASQPGHYQVIARSGLRLRSGPGTDFEVQRLLPLGTALRLVALDTSDPSWGSVDLEDDGLIDGYVHCGFLAPADGGLSGEFAPEPDDGDNG